MDRRSDFLAGVKDTAPILLGIIPFAMISGITAVNAGIPEGLAMLTSVVVFAGASQLAATQLVGAGAAAFVIIYTALVINARFIVYSASVAPYLKSLTTPQKLLYSYLLTDQGYAMSVLRFREDETIHPPTYYLGAAVPIWTTWQIFSAAGIYLGSGVPGHWGLDFAVPITFLAVLIQALDDGNAVIAALAGGGVAVLAQPLPWNLNLIMGVVCGITAGLCAESLARRKEGGL